MKFVVTGLPRSRTKWASAFLSTPDCPVQHGILQPNYDFHGGISEPSVLLSWRDIPSNTPIVYIHRPLEEVSASLDEHDADPRKVILLIREAEKMVASRDVLMMDFHRMNPRLLWEHCYGTDVSDDYIKVYTDMNIRQQTMEDLRRVA